ncbi:MAG: hypothetical protein ACUVUE_07025 [Candidatus Bathycorpusculaceae bacterium]
MTEKGSADLDADFTGVWDLVPPEKGALVRLWRMASRSRIQYKVLTWRQRRYMDALMLARWDRIRSLLVLKILAPIVKKLLSALGRRLGAFLRIACRSAVDEEAVKAALSLMGETAYRMVKGVAKSISRIAQGWGNKLAREWPEDPKFIRYLMVMSLPQNGNLPMFSLCTP